MVSRLDRNVRIIVPSNEVYSASWSLRSYDDLSGISRGALLSLKISPRSVPVEIDEVNEALNLTADYHNESLAAQSSPLTAIRNILAGADGQDEIIFAFIVPLAAGYITRSDFIDRRFEGSTLIKERLTFVKPLQQVSPVTMDVNVSFKTLVETAVGGFLLKTQAHVLEEELLSRLSSQLTDRLSYHWLSPQVLQRKRLAWVEGRANINVSRRIWETARALGITIVVIDNPGHWLEDDNGPYAHFRERFLPVRISVDAGFVQRIVEAIKSYPEPIDGIMTISDARVMGVAEACEILGYTTSPSAAYVLAGDKAKTRQLEPDGAASLAVNNLADLRSLLDGPGLPQGLNYPLIVKPCMGWGSECVTKVSDEKELFEAAARASQRHATSPQQRKDFMIENYIEGPEVDANFVLQDGKIVFAEIADDFPSTGDYTNAGSTGNFQETANLLPCGLPADELEIINTSLLASVTRMGFTDGTFHCEGRVRNSRLRFATDHDGLEDLVPVAPGAITTEPTFYLHEINARPAGYLESVAIDLTWGVDYYALQMLFSLGDADRFSALTRPFASGPQWHLALLLIPEEGEGTMKTLDTVHDLITRHPDIREHIPDYNTVVKGGDKLRGPLASELSYLAYISVISREGRKDCLRLADKVRREFKYELV